MITADTRAPSDRQAVDGGTGGGRRTMPVLSGSSAECGVPGHLTVRVIMM